MTETPPPRKRRSYEIDREAAVQVVIAFGTLFLAGAIVDPFVPLPYTIPAIFAVWIALMVVVNRVRKRRSQTTIPPEEVAK
jgi:predicted membrane protein